MKKLFYTILITFFTIQVSISQKLPELIPYQKGEKWGYCDKNKKIIIPCTYSSASPFYEGLARVSNEQFKFGFVNTQGKLVIPCKYDWAHNVHEGWIYVEQQSKKWGNVGGFIDTKGEVKIPMRINMPPVPLPEGERYQFSEGLIGVPWKYEPFGKFGYRYADKSGKFVLDTKYEYARKFNNGLAAAQIAFGNAGYINRQGKVLFTNNYYVTASFSEGLARVRPNSTTAEDDMKFGFINTKGKLVIPTNYYSFNNFSEGLVAVQQTTGKNKWGFLNKKGKAIIPFIYDKTFSFHNGLAMVVKNNKVGFINAQGKVVVPFKFDYNQSYYETHIGSGFANNFASVWQGKKMGFVNRQGKLVVECKYDGFGSVFHEYDDFSKGVALVKVGDKQFYIDMQGNEYYED
ncbi:hypothetical protein BKI52_27080 [marine bacterium AO1-C]|nr:hypothetical protein BKI52_27080 [marine bacterium AO1-C]